MTTIKIDSNKYWVTSCDTDARHDFVMYPKNAIFVSNLIFVYYIYSLFPFSRDDRLSALRGLLYICQGCWLECQSDSECLERCKENVVLLYEQGVFSSAVELLSIEME